MGLSPYAITFLLSFIISYSVAGKCFTIRKVPKNIICYSILLNLVLTIYGAKMYMVFVSGFQMNIFNSGISSMGGVIGMFAGMLTMGFIYKEGRRDLLETYALIIPLLYSISKIGCHISGCCHGISYNGPGAIRYDNQVITGGPYFPVQITESIVFLLIFILSLLLYLKRSNILLQLVVILCGASKFGLEFLREEHIGKILSANQIFCLMFIFLGFVIMGCGRKANPGIIRGQRN